MSDTFLLLVQLFCNVVLASSVWKNQNHVVRKTLPFHDHFDGNLCFYVVFVGFIFLCFGVFHLNLCVNKKCHSLKSNFSLMSFGVVLTTPSPGEEK